MTLQWVLGWWNLIFVVPFGIALVYLAVYALTGLTFGDADVDAGHDVHAGGGFDHDAHAALGDHAAHREVSHHDVAHHDPHDAGRGGHHAVAELFGIGRVPFSLLLMNAMFLWGISGFVATQALRDRLVDGERIALGAVPIAAVVTLALTALFSRLMPRLDGPATARRDFEGREGVAVLEIGDRFGLARVSPADGSASVQVPCRVADGQPAIPANAAVVVLRFDRAEQLFYVTTPARRAAFREAPASVASVE